MAIRLLSNENIDGNLTINGTGTANAPTLAVDTTSSSVFNHAIEAFNGNLTANEGNYIFVGKEGSSKNTGYIGYKYSGTPGSNSNILTFGHWASDNLMNLTGDGKLGIGTESPAEKLEVSGSIKSTSRAITGGSTPGITLSYDTSNSIGLIESWTSKPIGIETAGVRRITILSNGYVGIATTSPSQALDVNGYIKATNTGAGYVQGVFVAHSSTLDTPSYRGQGYFTYNEDLDVSWYMGTPYTNGDFFCINRQHSTTSFDTAASYIGNANTDNFFSITNAGNVGIGTTSPSNKLFVTANTAGDYAAFIENTNSTNGYGLVARTASTGTASYAFAARAASTDIFVVRADGNVGIGTTSLTNSSGYNTLSISGTTGAQISFQTSGVGKHYIYSTATDFHIYNSQAGNLKLYTNSTERMRIDGSGTIIGTGTYSAGSSIKIFEAQRSGGAVASDWSYDDATTDISLGTSTSHKFSLKTGNTRALTIDSSQNVGIGTTSPSATLHVQTASGIKLFNDNTYGYISIGSSGLTGQYPYLRVDSFRSDGSGYFWAFGHETPSGVKSIKMLINDGGSDQVTVINSLAISRFTSNEFNGSYPSLSTGALIRSNDTSYFNGGNVGIGTTSPSYKLSVEGDIKMNHANAANNYYLWLNKRSGQDGGILFQQDNSLEWQVLNSGSTGDLKFYSYGTSTMVMTLQKSTGNVGIGATSTANERLLVSSSSQYGVNISHNKANSTSDFEDALFLQNSDNNNANVCRIGMSTYGADGQHHRVSLMAERDTSANYRGEFSIAMRQSDSTHPKRLKLDYAGTLTVSGDVVAYGSPSDKRYKENIKPVTNALAKVSKLQGVTFDWKESESLLDIKEDIGFIAQDVQEVLPELVRENEDGKLSLRDKGIVPILVEAIKELKAEIEELKKSK